jgi:acetyl esterase/lipase
VVRLAPVRSWSVLGLAIVLIAVAVWIVAPPLTPLLLDLAVGAPELSPWLLLLSLLSAGIAAVDARSHQPARVALVLASSAALLASVPLVQFAAAARRAETAMAAALGEGFWDRVPQPVRAKVRSRALVARELFLGLRPAPVRIIRSVSIRGEEGEPLALEVYRPEGEGTYPVVVQIYGGAWQRGAAGDNARLAQELAGSGLVVFAIDYRHAPRWRWPAQLADVRAALRWIGRHAPEHGGDVTRLALLGRSSGAQLAMLAAYAPDAPAVRAVVNYYGPVDLVEGYRHPPDPDPLKVRGIEEAFLGGSPDQVPDAYRTASPISYVNRPLPPTLSIYGMRDHVVEPRFGSLLHASLRATGTTSVLLQIPWAEHAFDAVPQGPSAQLALYHTERFLAWALAPR